MHIVRHSLLTFVWYFRRTKTVGFAQLTKLQFTGFGITTPRSMLFCIEWSHHITVSLQCPYRKLFRLARTLLRNLYTLSHWNGDIIILTKSSSLAGRKYVIWTSSGAASHENVIKKTFPVQGCCRVSLLWPKNKSMRWKNSQ